MQEEKISDFRVGKVGPKERRFKFGRNWLDFAESIDRSSIEEAKRSLLGNLARTDLAGLCFLDAGCGSGLFSLAAIELGARVYSFDLDPDSVACTRKLREKYKPGAMQWTDDNWRIEQGSVLDPEYLRKIGSFDIVYSWGVLHHTGDLWRALDLITIPLAPDGTLYLAIYNDQGVYSKIWRLIKRNYCRSDFSRKVMTATFIPLFAIVSVLRNLLRGTNPYTYYKSYFRQRGMSVWHDWIDWLGGYPFEVAYPDKLIDFFTQRKMALTKLLSWKRGNGCNEYVFIRIKEI